MINKLISFILPVVVLIGFLSPGLRVANDYHLSSKDLINSSLNLPFSWNEEITAEGLGEYAVSTLWSWPLNWFNGFLSANVFYSDWVVRVIDLVIIIALAFWGVGKLLESLKINRTSQYIGKIFFILNSYFLLLLDGGQINLALSYSSLPLAIYLYRQASYIDNYKSKIYSAIIWILISIFDIRTIYILSIIWILDFIFHYIHASQTSTLKLWLINILITGLCLIGFHSYWILPSILLKAPSLPAGYTNLSQLDFLNFASLIDAVFFYQPHWYKNVFGSIGHVSLEFILIPILVFMVFLQSSVKKVEKQELFFWAIVSLVGIILASGLDGPIPNLYSGLFLYLPGFSLFRDPSKFNFLIGLGYSVLMAYSVAMIGQLKLNKLKFRLIYSLILIYLLFLIRPVFLGQMTGMFSSPPFQTEFLKLSSELSIDHNFGRVLWIPSEPPLGYSDTNHPVVESLRLIQKRPFAIGLLGQYEKNNYLREASFSGQLLDISGISYIVYPALNPKRDNMHPDNIKYYSDFLSQLKRLPWTKEIESPPVATLKVSKSQDKFFMAGNSWLVIGSDDIYNKTVSPEPKLNLSNNVFIFHDEDNGDIDNNLLDNPQIKILLNKKSNIDLAVSFIKSSSLIFPALNLKHEPDVSGWWKRTSLELINFRDFLKEKYQLDNQDFDLGGGLAVAEGELTKRISNPKIAQDKILLIRLLESPKGGQIQIYQENKLIGEVNTIGETVNLKWFEIGRLKSNSEILIKTSGQINVINALAVKTDSDWINLKNKANSLISQKKVLEFNSDNIRLNSSKISYKKINQTKYEVLISDLNEPSVLVFSENYDPLWKIDNTPGVKVYSFLNGFFVEKNGTYQVEYSAQKYLNIGLIITGLTCLLLFGLIIFLPRRTLRTNI